MSRRRSRRQVAQLAPVAPPAIPDPPFVPTAGTPRLHYRGDHRNFDPNRVYGPDAFRCFYRAGSAEYDEARDRTTIYFRPIVPARAS